MAKNSLYRVRRGHAAGYRPRCFRVSDSFCSMEAGPLSDEGDTQAITRLCHIEDAAYVNG